MITRSDADAVAHPSIDSRDRLIFALDVPDADTARRTVAALGDSVQFYKLGLELAMSPEYFGLIDELTATGRKVFADLKLYDIPATVAAAVRRLNGRGIHFVTVHGDRAIMEAAADAAVDVNILA
ncbi:MAG: orotidine-5'-phosphate decarboxylase, partial [Gammaproteobacteria bacterium]|nr:orotidine-5'-phosphate decarboxylase [Gammaproteobacteria bacterium]